MRRLLMAAGLLSFAQPATARELKVCADPNNLPFSNSKEEGFENKVIRIVAEELRADIRYVWFAQRRGNVRETLNAGLCDIIPGVGSSLEMLATTRPYYRSTYVTMVRDPALKGLTSFDDPRLNDLRIGVQLIGDDGSNAPPAHSLSRRGLVDNVRGYPIYGDYGQAAPQRPIVDAIASGEIDVAFVWGPTAGYFAKTQPVELAMSPVTPQVDGPTLPMVYEVSMGLRRADVDLKREIEAALARRAADIRKLLIDYGVPLVD